MSASTTVRIAVYGDVDLNLLDGSAIWLASLVQVLAGHPAVEVRVLLKAPVQRDLVTGPLEGLPRVTVVPPGEVPGFSGPRLSPEQAMDEIERWDEVERLDAVVLRGFALAREAATRRRLSGRLWCYLTDIPQTAEEMTEEAVEEITRVAVASDLLLCQTEELRSFLETHVPMARRRNALLPPMIPPPAEPADQGTAGEADEGPLRIVYAGKFAPLWASREMLDIFGRFREGHPDAELHVYGDKIHNPPDDPTFAAEVRQGLESTPGVVWHAAVSRDELLADLPSMDLAWSWRLAGLDGSLELSTKLLEYGAAGLAILLNRNPINEQLLGSSYPLYAGGGDEVLGLLDAVAADRQLLAQAAHRAERASRAHTFDAVRQCWVDPLVERLLAIRRGSRVLAAAGRPTVLLAGHDFRFAQPLRRRLAAFGLDVLEDRWENHDVHDESRSRELLARADVIHCEWCLGNAVWYAAHKNPQQRLVSRFHLQERDTPHPAVLNIEAVDRVIFVGPHIRDEALRRYDWPWEKVTVIGNYIADRLLDRTKLAGASFNLGMIGICPSRKRLDLALDVLEHLRSRDRRYVLYVKGKLPDEYPWLWARTAERAYYEALAERIAGSPLLSRGVVFDGFGDDVPLWLRKIGWVLSPSDFESFHLAVAEGAASGAVPVVLPWDGADQIYPREWVSRSPRAAAERITAIAEAGTWRATAADCREVAATSFGMERILDELTTVVLGRSVTGAKEQE